MEQNTKLHRRKDDYLIDIYKSAIFLIQFTSLEDIYKNIVFEAAKLAPVIKCSILMCENGDLVRVFSTFSPSRFVEPGKRVFVHKAMAGMKTMIISSDDFLKTRKEAKKKKKSQIIIIPLVNEEKSFGALSLQSKAGEDFNKNVIDALSLYGHISSLVIIKAKLVEDLRSALNNRDLFLSVASHELKSPLTTIKSYSQLIDNQLNKRNVVPTTWPQQIIIETDRAIRLINELFQVNQIKMGKMVYNFTRFSFHEAVMQAIKNVQQIHPDYKIILRESYPKKGDKIYGDYDKIIQVMLNLLNNAAKHSPFGSKIIINIKFDNSTCFLTISDQGSGILKENIKHIFDEFYQPVGEKKGGLGLGLFVVKNIIDAHGGTIRVKSRIGSGTTFFINLPLKHAPS